MRIKPSIFTAVFQTGLQSRIRRFSRWGFSIICFGSLFCGESPTRGDEWPNWRGPRFDGTSLETQIPVSWDKEKNVAWKVALPAPGNSSPIVIQNQVIITQSEGDGKQRSLISYSAEDGKQLWKYSSEVKEPEPTHPTNPHCAGSPASDGKHVVAILGAGGVVCCDLDGKLLWKKELGTPEHLFGQGPSPIIWEDVCILNYGPGKEQFFMGVSMKDGSELWRIDVPQSTAPNPFDQPGGPQLPPGSTLRDPFGTWATPIIREVQDHPTEVLLSFPDKLMAVGPRDGKTLWECAGNGAQVLPSPVHDGTHIACLGGAAFVVKPAGQGDQIANRLWYEENDRQRIGTGIIYNDKIYVATMQGIIECLNLQSGERLWHRRMSKAGSGGGTWSSIVRGGTKLYAIDQAGTTHVYALEPEFLEISSNELGESTNATPAISNGRVFIRTEGHLWCIKDSDSGEQGT